MISVEVIKQFTCSKEQDELFVYNGNLSSLVLPELLKKVETALSEDRFARNMRKNTLHILIECLQNVLKYGRLIEGERKVKLLIVCFNNQLEIKIGNAADSNQIQVLKDKIDELNQLDQHELREVYRKKLTDSFKLSQQSIGLGLVDMARKSLNQMTYTVYKLIDNIQFVVLHIKIPHST